MRSRALAYLSRAVAFLSVIPAGNLLSRPTTRRYLTLTALLCAITLLGASDPEHQYQKQGHEMICTCGCNQILLECNHVGCPVSPVMIGELRDQIARGGPENLVFNWFAAKYGATVLAAPMRGGFDNIAWITPLAVFFFATAGVAFLIHVWKLRPAAAAAAIPGGPIPAGSRIDEATRARIRQETQY